jgi:hypothetical protein
MATAVHLPVSDYLRTTYRPDREYIDGELRERNMGKWEHARLQLVLAAWFYQHEAVWISSAAPNSVPRLRPTAFTSQIWSSCTPARSPMFSSTRRCL